MSRLQVALGQVGLTFSASWPMASLQSNSYMNPHPTPQAYVHIQALLTTLRHIKLREAVANRHSMLTHISLPAVATGQAADGPSFALRVLGPPRFALANISSACICGNHQDHKTMQKTPTHISSTALHSQIHGGTLTATGNLALQACTTATKSFLYQ